MAKQTPTSKDAVASAAKRGTAGNGTKPAKPAKAAKAGKDAKAPKEKKQRLARVREIFQAYKMLKPQDPRLGLWIALAAIGAAVVVMLLAILFFNVWLGIIPAILFAVVAGLFVFSFRARRTTYAQAEGQAGAASWAMKQMRGDWRITDGVAGNSQSDMVHRVIGRPGIVLVAEGNPGRLRGLLAQEKKRLSRVVGDTPIYDVQVGDGEGQIPLKKLNSHIMKLPRNIQGQQIRTLEKRLQAVGAPRMPLPQGPLPGGRKMQVNARQLRRRS